jgi:parvulin-like peptidyl-prolyl isomerase
LLIICLISAGAFAFAEMVDKVIVVVNDEVITQREFDRAFDPILTSFEANFKGEELAKRVDEAKKALTEQIINTKLAISLAKTRGLEVDEEKLQARVDKIKAYYGTEEEFLKALEDRGTNLTEFRKELSDQIVAQEVVDTDVASKIIISPVEISELYEKNKDKMIAPVQVKIRGIMVKKDNQGEGSSKNKKIQDIHKRLKNGEEFSVVAKEHSEGPYAENGGDMGFVAKGQLLPIMDKAVFDANKEDITDIVESDIGYHIFLIEERQESRQLELEEVSDYLRGQLFRKKFEENLLEWLKAKRENAYIAYK